MEVSPDGGRLHDPVQLAVGPVLHQDDLAADKTLAMWGRGEPRDYLDVATLLQRYSHATLVALAQSKDRGLTVDTFIVSLRMIRRFGDRGLDGRRHRARTGLCHPRDDPGVGRPPVAQRRVRR